jgi:peptidoglycan/LPS O-acetylase OafA/YrhL
MHDGGGVGAATATARRYRAEIDGLRAIAVLGVLLYHAELGVPGGFVGVDVFFVLSGFLIAELLWTDLQRDRWALAGFLERRARRVLPALVVVTLATLVAGWLLLLPDEYAELGRSAAAQAVLGANVWFWHATDYFARPAEQLPLLHTWSLAVEQQFYLIAPFLLLGLHRLRAARAAAALAALAGASFAASVIGVARGAPAAFYLLPARLWELLLGAALVLVPALRLGTSRALREALGWIALALVVVPAFAYGKTTPFPGVAAVPPCVGTVLLLWANAPSRTTAGRLLSLPPLVFVGLVSYSLYLWHWPLLAFARASALLPLSTPERAALLGAACVLAVLSWRFVERPFRVRRCASSSRSFAAWTTTSLAVLLVSGLVIGRSGGFPQRFPDAALEQLAATNDRAFLRSSTIDQLERGELIRFGSAGEHARVALLVWGDSHAMAAMPAFDDLLKERGLAGEAALYVSTAPLLGFVREPPGTSGLGAEAPRFNDAVLRRIREQHIPDVFLIANWAGYRTDASGPSAAKVVDALVATVAAVAQTGARAWVLLQIPGHRFAVPSALARAALWHRDVSSACAVPDGTNGITGSGDPDVPRRITAAGGRIVDPRPRFLDARHEHYVVSSDGSALYADSHHLTIAGARLILLPLLRETLQPGDGARGE